MTDLREKAKGLLEGIECTTCCDCIHKDYELFVESITEALDAIRALNPDVKFGEDEEK